MQLFDLVCHLLKNHKGRKSTSVIPAYKALSVYFSLSQFTPEKLKMVWAVLAVYMYISLSLFLLDHFLLLRIFTYDHLYIFSEITDFLSFTIVEVAILRERHSSLWVNLQYTIYHGS